MMLCLCFLPILLGIAMAILIRRVCIYAKRHKKAPDMYKIMIEENFEAKK